jgi:hypothetical protein
MSEDRKNLESKCLATRLITGVLHRYCAAVDSYDADTFAAIWTEDAYVDFGERYRGKPSGFQELLIRDRNRTLSMAHQMKEIVIDLLPEVSAATSRCIVSAVMTQISGDGRKRRLVRGRYEDKWVLTRRQWLIQHRVYRPIEETQLPE